MENQKFEPQIKKPDVAQSNIKQKRKIPINKTKEIIKKIPQQKQHLEFISALLTIPVLITVLLLNLNNLKTKPNATPTPTLTPSSSSPTPKVSTQNTDWAAPPVTSVVATSIPQPTADPNQCIQGIGPIDISYPSEGQTVTENPVCVSISYTAGNYCAIVWAYRINNGPLSDYTNNSVCLYNLPQGNNVFTLQVKSLTSNNNTILSRHFFVSSNNQQAQPTLTPTNAATTSASIH